MVSLSLIIIYKRIDREVGKILEIVYVYEGEEDDPVNIFAKSA